MTEVSQLLQNFSSIYVSGTDAFSLLQGQFTADLSNMTDHETRLCAYCDVNGRVGWIFTITLQQNEYLIELLTELIPSFLRELNRYAVFSEVIITQSPNQRENNSLAERQAIIHKLPMVYLATQFKYLPHDLRLPELAMVSFNKGCFKGQEIIARMEHRGNIKRQTYIIAHEQKLTVGEELYADGQEVGSIVRTSPELSLAVISKSYLQTKLNTQEQSINILN